MTYISYNGTNWPHSEIMNLMIFSNDENDENDDDTVDDNKNEKQ